MTKESLGQGAEKVTRSIGMRLNSTPVRVIAECEGAELIDRFVDAFAGADDENACGFIVRTGGANDVLWTVRDQRDTIFMMIVSYFDISDVGWVKRSNPRGQNVQITDRSSGWIYGGGRSPI